MKKRSLIAVILCIALAASMLAACGSKTPEATETPAASDVTLAPTATPDGGSQTGDDIDTDDTDDTDFVLYTPEPLNTTSGLGIGDVAKGSEFSIEVLRINTTDGVDKGTELEYMAGSGKTIIAVQLRIKNLTNKEALFTATSSISASVKGTVVQDFAYLTNEFIPADEASIEAGGTFDGYVLFEAPADGGILKLTYNGNGLDGSDCGIFELNY